MSGAVDVRREPFSQIKGPLGNFGADCKDEAELIHVWLEEQ